MKYFLSHACPVPALKVVSTPVLLMLGGGGTAAPRQKVTRTSQPAAQNESTNSNASPDQRITINTDLATPDVTAVGAHTFNVPGLGQKRFTITGDDVPQGITLSSDADLPPGVGIVFDVSGPVKGMGFERAEEAPANFIQTGRRDDEYFLTGFNSQPQLLWDGSRDGDAVARKLSLAEPESSTALCDAAHLALEKVRRGVYPKRAIPVKVMPPPELNRLFTRSREGYDAIASSP